MSNTPVNHSTIVTPCVGVWIETAALLFPMLQVLRSHPAWVCGLKQIRYMDIQIIRVTPCVGVWIETFDFICWSKPPIVTPCVGVWIETISFAPLDNFVGSHPAWVCGLKQKWSYNNNLIGWSHPAWVCGLKHYAVMFNDFKPCHTLRGCVDWNSRISDILCCDIVTPCVGVWIETLEKRRYHVAVRHTLRGCVDWNLLGDDIRSGERSHTLRGCVDWNFIRMIHNNQQEGHTLRGCVDWNHDDPKHNNLNLVTPCVGVWIETLLRV